MTKNQIKQKILKRVASVRGNRERKRSMVFGATREYVEAGCLPEMADYYLAMEIIKELGV
jgi:predicted DNA-binding protein